MIHLERLFSVYLDSSIHMVFELRSLRSNAMLMALILNKKQVSAKDVASYSLGFY
jgi:hypothetical protein